jgi:hypothetical protein
MLANAAAEASAVMLPTGRSVHKPTAAYMVILALVTISMVWGTFEAMRAFREGTTRLGYARLGLVLNGLFLIAALVVLAIMVLGALLWSTMGR